MNETSTNEETLANPSIAAVVAGLGALGTAGAGVVTALINAVNLKTNESPSQAAVTLGAFGLAAVSIWAFSWIFTVEYRTRVSLKVQALQAAASPPAAAQTASEAIWVRRSSDDAWYQVLSCRWVNATGGTAYLIQPINGQEPAWIERTLLDGWHRGMAAPALDA